MVTALAVVEYLRTKHLTGEMQAQKLLYYVQGWSLAWTGCPAFGDPIEAWQMGPVVRSVRHAWPTGNAHAVPDDVREIIDAVYEYYHRLSDTELARQTHAEPPWINAWGDCPKDGRGDDPIDPGDMLRFFTSQSLTGNGPKRPPLQRATRQAPADLVASASHAAGKQWQRALALLAE